MNRPLGPGSRNLRSLPTISLAVIVALLATACSVGAGQTPSGTPSSAPPSATPSGSVDAAGFVDAWCVSLGEFFLGFGNPDTNVMSAAWKRFESAIEQGDEARLDSAATDILAHLEAARSANARGATWAPGAAVSVEFEAVLVGLKTQVSTVVAARGDPSVAQQAAATMQTAWPHFFTYIQEFNDLLATNALPAARVEACAAAREPAPSG